MARRNHRSINSRTHRSTAAELVRLAEAARRAGVTVNQLQYYLYMEIVKPTPGRGAKQRVFDRKAVQRIRMVKLLNESGYPLREIREIFVERRYRAAKRRGKKG